MHLTKPGLNNHQAAIWAVDEVNQLIRPDFVQFIGDNVRQYPNRLRFSARFPLLASEHAGGEAGRPVVGPGGVAAARDRADPSHHGRYTPVPVIYPVVTKTAFC